MRSWGGRESQRLVALVLAAKGDTCWLCLLPTTTGGRADSADHDPPRSRLLALGVPNPDDLRWLYPAHRSCNVRRKARPVDDDLRRELRERRLRDLGLVDDPTRRRLSPSIAARRPSFESARSPEGKPAGLSPNRPQNRPIEQEGSRP